MKLVADRAEVSVPGSIAGLGSGYHVLAVAVGPVQRTVVRAVAGDSRIMGLGPLERGMNPRDHGTVRAALTLLDRVGAPQVGLLLQCLSRLPAGSGLGGHAADVATGLVAVRGMLGSPPGLGDEDLVDMAVELGVDRVRARAALFGGAALGDAEVAWTVPTSSSLTPVAFVPNFALDEQLRVPESQVVRYPDAQASAQSLGLQVALLTGALQPDRELLMAATQNAMSRDQGPPPSPASAALVEWLRKQSVPAFTSGQGPAVVSLSPVSDRIIESAARSGWQQLDLMLQVRSALGAAGSV